MMKNELMSICYQDGNERFNSIISLLEENNIPYRIDDINIERKYEIPRQTGWEKLFEMAMMMKMSQCLADDLSEDFDAEEWDEEFDDLSLEDLSMLEEEYGKDCIDELLNEEDDKDVEPVYEYYRETAKNIVVPLREFSKNQADGKIILTAHHDIVRGSCGANDNGASIIILINLAKYIIENGSEYPVEIIFFDKEECGGTGCRNYIKDNQDILLMVNLDVCGVGNEIVISDETSLSNIYAKRIRDNIIPYDVVESDLFPYGDARTAERLGLDVFSVSVFPDEDIPYMASIKMDEDDKIHVREHDELSSSVVSKYSSIFSGKFFKLALYKYMHNGSLDDIAYINYDTMRKIYYYLIDSFC